MNIDLCRRSIEHQANLPEFVATHVAIITGAKQYLDLKNPHPMPGFPPICLIKNVVSNPNMILGDYTEDHDLKNSEYFERNMLDHYPFVDDQLIIGKFCAFLNRVAKQTVTIEIVIMHSIHECVHCPQQTALGWQ